MMVTCYLDESGTDSQSSQAVVAGFLLNKNNYLKFDDNWNHLLNKHHIEPPLHMNEFGQHGRHRDIDYPERALLFTDIANLINDYKIHSVAARLKSIEFKNIVDGKIRKHMGVYGMCFMLAAHLVFITANQQNYYDNISFLIEQGNKHCGHILKAHHMMTKIQKVGTLPIHVGTLAFDVKDIFTLQASDVIAWGINRRDSKRGLDNGFEPIAKIFKKAHNEHPFNDELLKAFNDAILS